MWRSMTCNMEYIRGWWMKQVGEYCHYNGEDNVILSRSLIAYYRPYHLFIIAYRQVQS